MRAATTDDIAGIAAQWWGRRLHHGNANKFSEALRSEIASLLANGNCAMVAVNHDPDQTLLAALRAAGIECTGFLFSARGVLPTKTIMWIDQCSVQVAEGYGAPVHTVWRKD
jgi:hypothetical protein